MTDADRSAALLAAQRKFLRSHRLVVAKMFRTRGPTPEWVRQVAVRRAAAYRELTF